MVLTMVVVPGWCSGWVFWFWVGGDVGEEGLEEMVELCVMVCGGFWVDIEDWEHGEIVVEVVADGAEGEGVLSVCEGAGGAGESG